MIALEDTAGMKATKDGLTFVSVTISDIYRALSQNYSYTDVGYTVLRLSESGHIVTDANPGRAVSNNGAGLNLRTVYYITPKGHDFLAGIRDKETWTAKMKPVFDRLGSVSLSVIEALSKGAMDALLDRINVDTIFSQLQLPK